MTVTVEEAETIIGQVLVELPRRPNAVSIQDAYDLLAEELDARPPADQAAIRGMLETLIMLWDTAEGV